MPYFTKYNTCFSKIFSQLKYIVVQTISTVDFVFNSIKKLCFVIHQPLIDSSWLFTDMKQIIMNCYDQKCVVMQDYI